MFADLDHGYEERVGEEEEEQVELRVSGIYFTLTDNISPTCKTEADDVVLFLEPSQSVDLVVSFIRPHLHKGNRAGKGGRVIII